MRDILFRGKRLDNGEWVYGFYCHVPRGRLDRDEHLIQTVKKSGKMGMLHCVDPSTVGQDTGLKDKNGKRIFEGDIMAFAAYGFDYVGTVEFADGSFSIMCEHTSPFLDQAVSKHGAYIIGNIHDGRLEFLNRDEEDGILER